MRWNAGRPALSTKESQLVRAQRHSGDGQDPQLCRHRKVRPREAGAWPRASVDGGGGERTNSLMSGGSCGSGSFVPWPASVSPKSSAPPVCALNRLPGQGRGRWGALQGVGCKRRGDKAAPWWGRAGLVPGVGGCGTAVERERSREGRVRRGAGQMDSAVTSWWRRQ